MTPIEKYHVEQLVREVLSLAEYDDSGVVTIDLIEKAETVAELLGLRLNSKGEDLDEEE